MGDDMSKNKIIYKSDIFVVICALMLYGCASTQKEYAVDWSAINYSKIACGGLSEVECKKKDIAAVDTGGKR